jgi:hypothetical protein
MSDRVRTRSAIDALERRGSLTRRQAEAARRLWSCYALGVAGIRSRDPGRKSQSSYIEATIAANEAYHRTREMLGPRLWPIAWSVCCGDQTVQEVASGHKQNPTATATLLRLALDLAADHYMLPEGD